MNPKKILLAAAAAMSLAVAAFGVPIPSNQLLGTITPGTPASPDNETEMVRFLVASLNAAPGTFNTYPGAGKNLGDNPDDPNTEVYMGWKPAGIATPLPLPTATGAQTVTSNVNITLTGYFDYIVAKFGVDAEVFWIANLTGDLTIPNLTGNSNGLSGYTLVNARTGPGGGGPGVPDSGATIGLLGMSLVLVEVLRRKFGRA